MTRGATRDGDTDFPVSYPQGATGRGVAYAALPPAQQALVRAAMARWLELPNGAIYALTSPRPPAARGC